MVCGRDSWELQEFEYTQTYCSLTLSSSWAQNMLPSLARSQPVPTGACVRRRWEKRTCCSALAHSAAILSPDGRSALRDSRMTRRNCAGADGGGGASGSQSSKGSRPHTECVPATHDVNPRWPPLEPAVLRARTSRKMVVWSRQSSSSVESIEPAVDPPTPLPECRVLDRSLPEGGHGMRNQKGEEFAFIVLRGVERERVAWAWS